MRRFVLPLWLCALFLSISAVPADKPQGAEPKTKAEKTEYKETSTHDDVKAFCKELARSSKRVHLTSLGTSTEKRDLPLLIIADPPIKSAEEARKSGKLVVYSQGNIHGGEVDGKEAMLMLARELALTKDHPLLKDLIVVIAPDINPDGNEKFSDKNRKSQNGPPVVGKRHNGQDLDLNRDWVKLESPEISGIVKFLAEWEPAMIIDCHTTNGSYHRYTLTYDGPRHPASFGKLNQYVNFGMLPEVGKKMLARSAYKTFYYGDFDKDYKKWVVYPALPRYSIPYWGLRNSIGILSESYMLASFKDRVLATNNFVKSCLEYVAENKDKAAKLVAEARDRDVKSGANPKDRDLVALRIEPEAAIKGVTVLAVEEEAKKDGRKVPTERPKDYKVDYMGGNKPTLEVRRPYAYVLPPGLDNVVANLRKHGIQVETLKKDQELEAEVYKIDKIVKEKNAFQKHHLALLDATPSKAKQKLAKGSHVVRTSQPLGTLAVYLLEPQSEDGLCAWNFFDQIKEGDNYPVVRVLTPVELSTK